MILEHHYMDRHFVEEVGRYYSKRFLAVPNHCTRIHFFREPFTEHSVAALIGQAVQGQREVAQRTLQDSYLGFVVVRPLSSVPIGRTVLSPLQDNDIRVFPSVADYDVHLMGFDLVVRGLAFQQQDRAVAACATTAIWTALQRLARNEGGRAPTPTAITDEAVRHYLPTGRAFPQSGLTSEQMLAALSAFDFPAASTQWTENPAILWLLIHVYLRSGIPVVLVINNGGSIDHAVCAMGHRRASQATPQLTLGAGARQVVFDSLNLAYDQIYVHDDRYGPYARAQLALGQGPVVVNGYTYDRPYLGFRLERPGEAREANVVKMAIAPLYPKLRTTAQELLHATVGVGAWATALADKTNRQLGLELMFRRSGTYQRELYEQIDNERAAGRFQREIAFSRYVGVGRWYLGDRPLVDMLWDTTDRIRHETHATDSLLGLVVLDQGLRADTEVLGQELGVPAW